MHFRNQETIGKLKLKYRGFNLRVRDLLYSDHGLSITIRLTVIIFLITIIIYSYRFKSYVFNHYGPYQYQSTNSTVN